MADVGVKVPALKVDEISEGAIVTERTPNTITVHFSTNRSGARLELVETRRPQTVQQEGFHMATAR